MHSIHSTLIAQVRSELARHLRGTGPAPDNAELVPPLSSGTALALGAAELARYLDSTLLKPEATAAQIDLLCEEALRLRVAAVCVHPTRLIQCVERLKGSGVKTATVAGFPLGAMTPEAKAFEAAQAIGLGADEIDMVTNIGRLKDGEYSAVREDIEAVVEAAAGRAVKVILESGGLTPRETVAVCLLARDAGAHFVKTSTGFLFGGATVEAVALMRTAVGDRMGVKAAGGIRDRATAKTMLAAGATRIGTSSAGAICERDDGERNAGQVFQRRP